MFITKYTKHKCSKCGVVGQTETVSVTLAQVTKIILRCLNCGHEKPISSTKISEHQEPIVYKLQQKEFEEF